MTHSTLTSRPAHVPADRVVDFDYYNPPNVAAGFQEAWRTLQVPGAPDLVWSPYNGGHWIATRGVLIKEVFSDFERFSNRVVLVPKEVGELHQMLPTTLDPPAHRPVRQLLDRNLAPVAIQRQEDMIRDVAVELIEGLAPRGRCDFQADYAAHFPIRVFMGMVDLPASDAPKLKHWTDQVVHPDGSMTYEEALQKFHDYLEPVVHARRGGQGTDVLSDIVNTDRGRELTMAQLLNLLTQLMMGGLDTVYNFLSYTFLFLARSPAHRRELVAHPARIPAAVNELLRRFPLVSMAREIRDDIEWCGVRLKQGEMIVCASPLVGNDEQLNPDPMTVDFARQRAQHATFGQGNHVCPGAHLARVEMRITLEEWLARIPEFSVPADADVRFIGGIVGSVNRAPLVWAVRQGNSKQGKL